MRTDQCPNCLRYRGDLDCDAYPQRIPEAILTGQYDHSEGYAGDDGIRFSPAPDFQKSDDGLTDVEGIALINYVNDVVEKEDLTYQRVKTALRRKGYVEADFELGGVLYGYSTNQLLDMVRSSRIEEESDSE